VVVDVSDLSNPKILGRAEMPGSAIRVDYSAGYVFVAAWNDARVYDATVPATPRLIGTVRLTKEGFFADGDRPSPTSRVLGIAARGNDVFVGNWHVLYSYRLYPDRKAPNIRLPEVATMVDFGPVAIGQNKTLPFEVSNQGSAPLTLLSNWIAGGAFTVQPRQIRVAPGDTATLSLTFHPTSHDIEKGYLQVLSDDPQSPRRSAYLVGNQPGLGVGTTLPEVTAVLLDGGRWSSTETEGTVKLLAYFATF
jgi:Abnormal spindle-like microcephaly-assoc'd, ASPM-SPD-2-Hydin/LVIVD repeat